MLDLRVRMFRRLPGATGEINKETVNVEIQTSFERYFADRRLAYASRLYADQLEKGGAV